MLTQKILSYIAKNLFLTMKKKNSNFLRIIIIFKKAYNSKVITLQSINNLIVAEKTTKVTSCIQIGIVGGKGWEEAAGEGTHQEDHIPR